MALYDRGISSQLWFAWNLRHNAPENRKWRCRSPVRARERAPYSEVYAVLTSTSIGVASAGLLRLVVSRTARPRGGCRSASCRNGAWHAMRCKRMFWAARARRGSINVERKAVRRASDDEARSEKEVTLGMWDALCRFLGAPMGPVEEPTASGTGADDACASGVKERSSNSARGQPLPCGSDVGERLLVELEADGEDAFLMALHAELLALRQTWGRKVAGAFRAELDGASAVSNAAQGLEDGGFVDDGKILKRRIAEVRTKEARERILADVLHIGAIQRLRAYGVKPTASPLPLTSQCQQDSGPDALPAPPPIDVNISLVDSLRPLHAGVAAEVRGYVLDAVPAEISGRKVIRVAREQAASLFMGAMLFGYNLASDLRVPRAQRGVAKSQDWSSDASFVAGASRVGWLLGLPAETDDPLQRYGCLREEIATQVEAEVRSAPLGEQAAGDASEAEPFVALRAEGLRGLLGELCTIGFSLNVWEASVLRFVGAHDATTST